MRYEQGDGRNIQRTVNRFQELHSPLFQVILASICEILSRVVVRRATGRALLYDWKVQSNRYGCKSYRAIQFRISGVGEGEGHVVSNSREGVCRFWKGFLGLLTAPMFLQHNVTTTAFLRELGAHAFCFPRVEELPEPV